ncbi:MAG: yggt family protein [Candidatus Binatus sp.]|nr:yggt family protein [Candidatus Binatus sp.]
MAWARLIYFTIGTIDSLLKLYSWVVIIAVLMTWIEPNPYNPVVRFIYSITEPVFEWIREHLPVVIGGLDLSPIIVFFVIGLIRAVLLPSLQDALVPQPALATGP